MVEQSREEIRSIRRRFWLTSLHEFTSIEEQERLWLAHKPGLMGSYEEYMCGYFDDTLHGKSLESLCDQGYLSQAEVEACRDFHQLADSYSPPSGDNYDHRSILTDPEWSSVTAAALEAWKRLRSIIEVNDERVYMDRLDAT